MVLDKPTVYTLLLQMWSIHHKQDTSPCDLAVTIEMTAFLYTVSYLGL